jgi:hypothetical protein
VVAVLFAGMLGGSWWLDRHPFASQVAGSLPHAEALERYGFALTEVSRARGVEFSHRQVQLDPLLANVEPHVAAMGAAVSVTDADGDGRPDLYATSSAFGTPNALFLQQPDGSFRDVAAQAGVADLNRPGEGASMGALWADIDNDGDEDLFVHKWGYSQLLRNERVPAGELRFTDVTSAAGLRRWMNSNGASWIDYDRDGLVDLYVAGYFPERFDLWDLQGETRIMHDSFEFATNGGHNVLWRNLGAGEDGLPRFEDVTARTQCDSTRWTLAVAAADFDGDGWLDLYLANDYGPEEFFRNVEGQRFELAGVGLSEDSKSGMSVALGDTRNAGTLDVYVTNISKALYLFQGNNLRVNRLAEGAGFENVAREGVLVDCGWAWGAQFGDLNNDGWQDLTVVNGFISADRERDYWYDMSLVAGGAGNLFVDTRNWAPIGDRSLSGYERSRVMLSLQGRRFLDVAGAVGCTDLHDGRAVALADLRGRGALDVIVANQRGPLLVYENQVDPARDWVSFALTGTASNRSALGASVTLEWSAADAAAGQPAARVQSRLVDGGSGFCSQNERALHFGLGFGARIARATVRWPSGHVQVLEAPALRTRHAVTEAAP